MNIGQFGSISDREFADIQRLLFKISGISLSDAKKVLVTGRLAKRLRYLQLQSYAEYFTYITHPDHKQELQVAIDLLTTNETYFFREEKHFEFLQKTVFPQLERNPTVRIWSAACSSGEEAYTLAMLLQERFARRWKILASDISQRVLAIAAAGVYPEEAAEKIPKSYLAKYCLKGVRSQAGYLMVDKTLRDNMEFTQINLNQPLPETGMFDIIFLRNVLIYFNAETKRQVIAQLLKRLNSGGYFITSHSETASGLAEGLVTVRPSIYRKS